MGSDHGERHVRQAAVQPDREIGAEAPAHEWQPRGQHELQAQQAERDDAQRGAQLIHDAAAGSGRSLRDERQREQTTTA